MVDGLLVRVREVVPTVSAFPALLSQHTHILSGQYYSAFLSREAGCAGISSPPERLSVQASAPLLPVCPRQLCPHPLQNSRSASGRSPSQESSIFSGPQGWALGSILRPKT